MYLDAEGIEKFVAEHDNDTKALKQDLLRACWFMRGGLSFSEAHNLTPDERGYIAKLIEENLETTKNTQMPFF